jgi:hypothetical protein
MNVAFYLNLYFSYFIFYDRKAAYNLLFTFIYLLILIRRLELSPFESYTIIKILYFVKAFLPIVFFFEINFPLITIIF